MGLATAAKRYVDDYAVSFGTDMTFVADNLDSPRLAPLAEATMYRVLQETLTNVARHARARRVAVELRRRDSALELLVRDDGVGFDVDQARPEGAGLGLHGMRERIALLGGSVQIESTRGRGTVVCARVSLGETSPPPGKNTASGTDRPIREESPP
jgi:signal transduction histidine kinase